MADYFADLDKAVEEESSAGGGIIALTRVDVGYKVYANNAQLSENSPAGKTPYTQGMTFFPTGPDKGSREKALDAAKKFAMAVGAKPPNGLSVQMICYKEGALSKGVPVTWQNDRNFVEALWENKKSGEMSDGAAIIKPALKALGKPLPWESWAQIGFKPSPSNRQDTDKDGNPRTALVAYPSRLFASEVEAKAQASAPATANGFNLAEWAAVKEDITAALKAKTKELKSPPKAKEAVAGEYGLTVEQLEQVIA